MREAHERARVVLLEHADRMHQMAQVLLAKETIEGEEMQALLDGTYETYLAAHPEGEEPKAADEPGEPERKAPDQDASDGDGGGLGSQTPIPVEDPAQIPVPLPEPPMAGSSAE